MKINEFDENEDIEVDAKAEQVTENINGKPITFKTGEIAEIFDESPAMIRYYCSEFKEHMTLDHKAGEHRTYTQKNIDELKYILGLLKKDGLSVKQVHEFLSSPEGHLAAPIFDQQDKMKVLINAMVQRIDTQLQGIVKRELENTFTPMFQEVIKNSVSDLVNNKEFVGSMESVNNNLNKIKEEMLENNKKTEESIKETSVTKVEMKIFEENIANMIEEKLKQNDIAQKKGFFGRLFGKN